MLLLRYHFKEPVVLSFYATLGLHLIFFIGICVFMTEEYYTLGTYGSHHRRHHKHYGTSSGNGHSATQPNQAPMLAAQPTIPEPDERFATRDEETNTYRLSPDLVKAFKSLDIAPVITHTRKIKQARKSEIIKEKPQKVGKHALRAKISIEKKHAVREPIKEQKHTIIPQKEIAKKAAPKESTGTHKEKANAHAVTMSVATTSTKQTSVVTAKSASLPTVHQQAVVANAHPTTTLPIKTTAQQTQTAPAPANPYDDEELAATTNTVSYGPEDSDTYDDDDFDDSEGTDDGSIIDTDTLSLAAATAQGGILSARQNHAAKQLSEHVVKQWKPPAGCHDASPVHVELTVQHDGNVVSKIIKTSSMPILNFAVKRMVAQFSTKAIQEMLEHARGTKLILIFKG